jgi:fucose 4-O-acetylase-like acetyltransferase
MALTAEENIISNISRDSSIDFLRTLGLFLVTLVHVNTLYSVDLLAYYGVPLMVFVSALCAKSNDTTFSGKNLVHRITRLLVPLWIFQTLYWIIFYKLETPSLYTMIQSYVLLSVTPYTWIIRVFLVLACLSPLLLRLARRCKNIYMMIVISIALQEILCYLYAHYSILHLPGLKIFIRDYILYTIPYSLIFVLAVFLKNLTRKRQIHIMLFTGVLLIVATLCFLGISDDWKSSYWLYLYKFPPRYMYTLYGLFCVQLLYLFREYYTYIGQFKLVRWISENSLWIYFFHIPLINYFPFNILNILSSEFSFVLRWMIVIIIACLCVALQNKIIGVLKTVVANFSKNNDDQ